MLGVNVKRGVATTLERVFNASGNQFDKLEVLWTFNRHFVREFKFTVIALLPVRNSSFTVDALCVIYIHYPCFIRFFALQACYCR